MNKAYLVALREFIENLRTKTFWLGILSVPIILVGTFAIMFVMKEAKDARPFGVIDQSEGQWLSKAVEDRGNSNDVELMLRDLKVDSESVSAAETRTELLARLQEERAALSNVDVRRKLLDLILDTVTQIDRGEVEVDPEVLTTRMIGWYSALSEEERGKLNLKDLDRKKFPLVPLTDEDDAKAKLKSGDIFAYFVIGPDPVATDSDSRYVSSNLTDNELRRWYANHATQVVRERRIAKLELTQEQANSIRNSFDFDSKKVSEETGEVETVKTEEKAHQFAPVAFVYLLWIAIMVVTQMLLTNTVEEKSNRIIEVLLSSVSPMQLMAGKIFGIAATGLTLVVFWFLCGVVAIKIAPSINEDAANLRLDMIIGDPRYVASFIGYFLGGYFFYAAILVGIGAVCNSLKEAQNLQQPVFILLIIPIAAMLPVVNNPNGTLAMILTYIPPFTPFLMMNRAAAPPPAWEYAATTVLIVVSVLIAFWGAAKIFRIGILMTGKPPRLREILGWLRAPVGATATLPND